MIEKFDKNRPMKAFDPKEVRKDLEGNYIVPSKMTRILYTGRYCAVSGFIYSVVCGKFCVLANLRGPGVPDFAGKWNCPCGFLEGDEDSIEGIRRETYEECLVSIPYKKLKVAYIETDPAVCNNGNVTIHHKAFLGKQSDICILGIQNNGAGGEPEEVCGIRWVPLDEVHDLEWAFNHEELIFKYAPSKITRKLLEFIYRGK